MAAYPGIEEKLEKERRSIQTVTTAGSGVRMKVESRELLFIEPTQQKSAQPTLDEITRKMTAAYRKTIEGSLVNGKIEDIMFMGWHECVCGAMSDNTNHVLPDSSMETNSLCIHYLAWHREEVPAREIEEVKKLSYGEEEPTKEELQ
ncbi:MAG: hypothetical protein HYY84_11100 [Deltaproteobacteria bacterium]|nr:hypothetical protein [Deltaproteobacteria bacterium]